MEDASNISVLGLKPNDSQVSFTALLKDKKAGLAWGLLFLILCNLVALSLPRLINGGVTLIEEQKVIDMTFFGSLQIKTGYLLTVILLIVGFAFANIFLRTFSRTYLFNVGRAVERDLRQILFSHLSTLSSNFYSKQNIGDLMSRLTNDITNVRLAAGFALLNSLNIVIIFVGTLPILIALNWYVAIAALMPFPLVMLVAKLVSKRMFNITQAYQKELSSVTTHVQENLSGIALVKAFGQEKTEQQRFEAPNEKLYLAGLDQAKLRALMFPLTRAMAGLGVVMTLYVGGYAIVRGDLDVGDFVEINIRLLQLTWPAISLGFIMSMYQRGKASLMRIQEILDYRPQIVDGEFESEHIKSLELKDASFKNLNKKFENISLKLEQGEVLGLVGPRGSGKSTLIQALTRQIEVESDQIFYGSEDNLQDIKSWNLKSLFKNIAVVNQEPYLFSMSVKDNIAFSKPDASEEEVWKLVKLVGLEKDVNLLPDGLDTVVGERGVMLSGGQRQRVAIARAIFTKADFIVLDDALSAVDAETEQHILRSLRELEFRPALIIASHRLSAVREAKEILVLDEGKVVERGVHKDLLSQDGLYGALWGREKLKEEVEAQL